MSRRHHHTGREPRTDDVRLDPLGESLLDALEVEIRARKSYEIAEQRAVDELNADRPDREWALVIEVPWEHTDPETRRDYRRHVVGTMHRAEQLVGDRAAKGLT